MKLLELFILALGLSMDAFAVSVCKGLAVKEVTPRQGAWVGLWFGGFQTGMPLLGFLLADSFAGAIAYYSHWLAFGLLCIIGTSMILETLGQEEEPLSADLGWQAMLLLAVATSIDALAAGISLLAMVDKPLVVNGSFNPGSIWVAVSLIGAVTFLLSWAGTVLGSRVGSKHGKKAEIFGGIILIFLGMKILLERLFNFIQS